MHDLVRKGIEEFNTQFFFEAHDTWEEVWRETSGPDRLFLQGLIHTTVAQYHLGNGNFHGARSQFEKALAKLERYLPCHLGVDTAHIAHQVRDSLVIVRGILDGTGDRSRLPEVPRIRYV
jgi:predicted metal-dependent hydrolase